MKSVENSDLAEWSSPIRDRIANLSVEPRSQVLDAAKELLQAVLSVLLGESSSSINDSWSAASFAANELEPEDLLAPIVRDLREAREAEAVGNVAAGFFARTLWDPILPSKDWKVTHAKWEVRLDYLQLNTRRYNALLEGRLLPYDDLRAHFMESESYAVNEGISERTEAAALLEASAPPEISAKEPEAVTHPAGTHSPIGRFTALAESLAERDLLGRQGLIDALSAMFADPEQGMPFTLALLGDWGAGKSSLMKLLQDKLAHDYPGRFDFAGFNAWEYENVGNMPAALAQEVVEALVRNMGRWEKVELRFRFGAREHRWSLVRALFYLLAAAVPLAVFVAVASFIEESSLLESLLGVGAGAGLVVFGVQVFRAAKRLWEHPMAVELKTYLDLPSYGEHLGLIPVLKRHLRTLCELRLQEKDGQGRQLVCFVDDLDRCKPESITQTLEAVRLVMDLPNVIVMIGIDQRIAVQAVADQYRDLASPGRTREDIARDYLGKVIQLSIRLDRPDSTSLRGFVGSSLFPGVELERVEPYEGREPNRPVLHLVAPAGGQRFATGEAAPQAMNESHSSAAPSPESPSLLASPVVPFDLAVAMADTAEERDRFHDLAVAHGFFNPRQLIRLRNSYRLLKLLEAQVARGVPEDQRLSQEQMMRMIFWQDFLQGFARETRAGLTRWLLHDEPLKDVPPGAQEIIDRVAEPLRQSFGVDPAARETAYERCARFASLLVLPRGD